MKSNKFIHMQFTKNIGWVRVMKYSLVWKNLKEAPKVSAENMGAPYTLKIGSFSLRLTRNS